MGCCDLETRAAFTGLVAFVIDDFAFDTVVVTILVKVLANDDGVNDRVCLVNLSVEIRLF